MYRFPLTRKHDRPSKLPELLCNAQIYQKVLQIIDVLYPTYTISDFCTISNFRITIRIFGEFLENSCGQKSTNLNRKTTIDRKGDKDMANYDVQPMFLFLS